MTTQMFFKGFERADIVMKSRGHVDSKNVQGPCTVDAMSLLPFDGDARPFATGGSYVE